MDHTSKSTFCTPLLCTRARRNPAIFGTHQGARNRRFAFFLRSGGPPAGLGLAAMAGHLYAIGGYQPSTLNPQPSTLNPQPSSLNPQPSSRGGGRAGRRDAPPATGYKPFDQTTGCDPSDFDTRLRALRAQGQPVRPLPSAVTPSPVSVWLTNNFRPAIWRNGSNSVGN